MDGLQENTKIELLLTTHRSTKTPEANTATFIQKIHENFKVQYEWFEKLDNTGTININSMQHKAT